MSSVVSAAAARLSSASDSQSSIQNNRLQLENAELEGPLWDKIKRQLYRSELPQLKRLVGDSLIQRNRMLWDELVSLRQILGEFCQDRTSDPSDEQHRELLRRQAQVLIEDVRSHGAACGQTLEELLPELRLGNRMRDFIFPTLGASSTCEASPPQTPSTHRSVSSGVSSMCSTPDLSMPPLPLGRRLSVDDLGVVAEGIREALEAEHEELLAAIGEQTQRFETEEARRSAPLHRDGAAPPSTAEAQAFVNKLQEMICSSSFKAMQAVAADGGPQVLPIPGGSSARRLKALIAQQRRKDGLAGGPVLPLASLPESNAPPVARFQAAADITNPPGYLDQKVPPALDPFFDDPFAA